MAAMDEAELQAMLATDERHWWYRGRRRIIRAVLDEMPLPPGARSLDAGCGSGRMLDELADYGGVSGIDVSDAAAAAARARGHRDVRVGPLETLPWEDGTFDLVTAFDVIEHTPDDRATLRELRRVTKPGGRALITVPAYQRLFSAHDVVNHHYRRYARPSLLAAAEEAGWAAGRTSYFNSVLLVPAAAVRLAQRRHRNEPKAGSDLALTPPRLNGVLELPLRAEAAWLRRGRRLPAGLSLLAVLGNPESGP
ncbi:MAG: methyltransferase [Solirubrobacterales bacterium]|nr:methyltransferase [Solirubrobacterales bacterium]